jgi:hypothetical protein
MKKLIFLFLLSFPMVVLAETSDEEKVTSSIFATSGAGLAYSAYNMPRGIGVDVVKASTSKPKVLSESEIKKISAKFKPGDSADIYSHTTDAKTYSDYVKKRIAQDKERIMILNANADYLLNRDPVRSSALRTLATYEGAELVKNSMAAKALPTSGKLPKAMEMSFHGTLSKELIESQLRVGSIVEIKRIQSKLTFQGLTKRSNIGLGVGVVSAVAAGYDVVTGNISGAVVKAAKRLDNSDRTVAGKFDLPSSKVEVKKQYSRVSAE